MADNQELIEKLTKINNEFGDFITKEIKRRINELSYNMREEIFTIVVLGEFKRGKSSFVNALLHTDILPVDVLPTTATINALMYDEECRTVVVRQDGTVKEGRSDNAFLSRYIAQTDFDIDEIQYLKVGLPAPILRNNVVIVDTPGVSDINEQRVKVTYDFIPRADAIIFLLDAGAPLKRTEREFIENHLFPAGIDRILFIANKFDSVDEDEEDDVIEEIKKRIAFSFTKQNGTAQLKEFSVLPLTATAAGEALRTGNKSQWQASGMADIEKKLQELIKCGTSVEAKRQRYQQRLKAIGRALEREINTRLKLAAASSAELGQMQQNLQQVIRDKSSRLAVVRDFIQQEQDNIFAMTKKSVIYFYKNLLREVHEQVDVYKGADFKDYVEKRITALIRKNMQNWVGSYFPAIETLFEKMESEIIRSLTVYFQEQVNMNRGNLHLQESQMEKHYIVEIEAGDVSAASTNAGMMAAGAAGLAMLVGTSVLLPVISLAAYPLLQKKLLNDNLQAAKLELKPKLEEAVGKCFYNMMNELETLIQQKTAEITANTDSAFNNLADHLKQRIDTEIYRHRQQQQDVDAQIALYKNKLQELRKIIGAEVGC